MLFFSLQKQVVLSLVDSICDLEARQIKKPYFRHINIGLAINSVISLHYKKGKSVTVKPSYDGLLIFKMCLLKTWYGLSDFEVEDRVDDSISFGYFCGLTIDQVATDHILQRDD